MSTVQIFDAFLAGAGLDGVRIVFCRSELAGNGDLESDFLDHLSDLQRTAPARGIAHALRKSAERPGARIVAVIRNPALVLDADLPRRIAQAIAALDALPDWAVGAAGGLGLGDARHLGLYASQMPRIPLPGGPQPLVDAMPDLYLVEADFARQTLTDRGLPDDCALESVLVIEGYLAGRLSVFLPHLWAGIDGALLARDLTRLSTTLAERFGTRLPGQTLPTLSGEIALPSFPPHPKALDPDGPVNLVEQIDQTLAPACDPVGLTIVTRTRFERPDLLHRLLTSISRARRDAIPLEIVLSTDAPEAVCTRAMAELRETFIHLDLRLQRNSKPGPSRVVNLIEGLRAARHDYVMAIDDDDYVDLFAFDALASVSFAGNRPLVICASQVHEEVWETGSERPVLARSTPVRIYPASGWRRMFSGVNQLPVCALVLPRDFALARIAVIEMSHDLSEDYALFLLFLTAPDLPAIREIPDVLCHISLRGRENSVTMEDRRPWVRDIAGHLGCLTAASAVAGAGTWALLAGRDPSSGPGDDQAIADLRRSLDRCTADIRLLRRENAKLRSELSLMEGRTA